MVVPKPSYKKNGGQGFPGYTLHECIQPSQWLMLVEDGGLLSDDILASEGMEYINLCAETSHQPSSTN